MLGGNYTKPLGVIMQNCEGGNYAKLIKGKLIQTARGNYAKLLGSFTYCVVDKYLLFYFLNIIVISDF